MACRDPGIIPIQCHPRVGHRCPTQTSVPLPLMSGQSAIQAKGKQFLNETHAAACLGQASPRQGNLGCCQIQEPSVEPAHTPRTTQQMQRRCARHHRFRSDRPMSGPDAAPCCRGERRRRSLRGAVLLSLFARARRPCARLCAVRLALRGSAPRRDRRAFCEKPQVRDRHVERP